MGSVNRPLASVCTCLRATVSHDTTDSGSDGNPTRTHYMIQPNPQSTVRRVIGQESFLYKSRNKQRECVERFVADAISGCLDQFQVNRLQPFVVPHKIIGIGVVEYGIEEQLDNNMPDKSCLMSTVTTQQASQFDGKLVLSRANGSVW